MCCDIFENVPSAFITTLVTVFSQTNLLLKLLIFIFFNNILYFFDRRMYIWESPCVTLSFVVNVVSMNLQKAR